MGRPCALCHHPKRDEIDRRIQSGETTRKLALDFGVSSMAVSRHKNNHLGIVQRTPGASAGPVLPPPLPDDEPVEALVSQPDPPPAPDEPELPEPPAPEGPLQYNAYARLVQLAKTSEEMLERAQEEGKEHLALLAMGEVRKNMETMLKVYETQARIRREFAETESATTSQIWVWLRAHYPRVLFELVAHLKEVRQG